MGTPSAMDVFLDMALCPLSQSAEKNNKNDTPIIKEFSIPQLPNTSISNFNIRKSFLTRIFGGKKKINFRPQSCCYTKKDNLPNVCEMLRKGLEYLSEASKDTRRFGFNSEDFLNSLEEYKDGGNVEGNSDPKSLRSNDKEHLERFFNYIIQYTSEFTEEEALELQIRILKVIRAIKAKREMKKHFRKYAAAMNIRDPLF